MAMSDSTVSTSATNRSKNILSLRSRAMIAETLVDMLKRSGDMGSILSGEIISVCLPLARQRISQEQYNLLDTHVDLSRFRVNTYVNNEENQQTMKSPDETNQTDENLTNQSLVKAAEAADALLFRQSAVSLLSEAFSRGGWNSVRFLSDVVDLAVGILTFETSLFCKYGLSDQANIIIRRLVVIYIKTIRLFILIILFSCKMCCLSFITCCDIPKRSTHFLPRVIFINENSTSITTC
jgi:hypothetical protein